MKNICCIILFLAASCFRVSGQASEPRSNKIIKKGDALYQANVFNGKTVLTVTDTLKNTIEYYKLPVEGGGKAPVAYDMAKDTIYSISVMEIAPLQYSFYLIKSPVKHLEALSISDTVDVKAKVLFYKPEAIAEALAISPLQSAYLQSQIQQLGPVYYDLAVSGNEQIKLFILLNEELTSWEYKNKKWININTVRCSFKGSFFAVAFHNREYIISNGIVYQLKNGMEKINEVKDKKDFMYLIDKDKEALFIVDGSGSGYHKFKRTIKVIE